MKDDSITVTREQWEAWMADDSLHHFDTLKAFIERPKKIEAYVALDANGVERGVYHNKKRAQEFLEQLVGGGRVVHLIEAKQEGET